MASKDSGQAMVPRSVATSSTRQAGAAAVSTPLAKQRLRPSIRKSVESATSTGSQAEFYKPEQTIILFDWDDTLCPSNWIRENRPALSFFKPAPVDPRFQKPLQELQRRVEALLRLSMTLGKVVIVTNAMEPWVETSCRNFLPQLTALVAQLPVIYARSIYEVHTLEASKTKASAKAASSPARGGALPGLYSANGQNRLGNGHARQNDELLPQRWKELVFDQEITRFYSRYDNQSWKNVISIGDSIFERDAARRVVLNRPTAHKTCHTKTAKLLDEPDIGELIAQVQVIHDAIGLMVQYGGNLDIEIDENDLNLDEAITDKILDR
eukprot:TRINITY_DN693_c0_g1_i1.p1 TRINITY_DN693_c0_g1~~TRINITY_DN693_c0_g1_i1.p1  ORF type:complete len:360 (-),score=45.52 TRINITY_DN693_c0_g1_i1:290-1264(-)